MSKLLEVMRIALVPIAGALIILSVAFVGVDAGFAAWCMASACCALVLYQL